METPAFKWELTTKDESKYYYKCLPEYNVRGQKAFEQYIAKLVLRDDEKFIYEIRSSYTNKILGWEWGFIFSTVYEKPYFKIEDWNGLPIYEEHFPSNEYFGKRSCWFHTNWKQNTEQEYNEVLTKYHNLKRKKKKSEKIVDSTEKIS